MEERTITFLKLKNIFVKYTSSWYRKAGSCNHLKNNFKKVHLVHIFGCIIGVFRSILFFLNITTILQYLEYYSVLFSWFIILIQAFLQTANYTIKCRFVIKIQSFRTYTSRLVAENFAVGCFLALHCTVLKKTWSIETKQIVDNISCISLKYST
jgi:hypothetical protein